ncbi:hypothetical protein H2200_002621 [Cladophialophora chaetospira]|uniref:Heterokaryon incompatibility domain-containing protein n=1 Tax=Cladophialophora chaetospira TaxID=386627 RepID=A0AA39CN77_9EURO|nr:hypothetical protein H2200_002621 [Cladophialophora chaetospira]
MIAPHIIRWLEDCILNHGKCQALATSSTSLPNGAATGKDDSPSSANFLPTRLVEMHEEAGRLRLKLMKSSEIIPTPQSQRYGPRLQLGLRNPEYVALSYCWGEGTSQPVTSQHTIGRHLIDIDIQSLPKTIQQAMSLVFRLGISYVWVDALCIIQPSDNDSSDWERESSMMGQVYSNSVFTLMAEHASDVHGGLLPSRPAFKYPLRSLSFDTFKPQPPLYFKKDVIPSTDAKTSLFTFCPALANVQGVVGSSPLSRRGWTLQERIMSTRAVHINAEGVFWNCAELAASEHHPTRSSAEDMADQGHYISYPRIRCRWDRSLSRDELIRMWMDIIRQYSARRLTNVTDKLPALSGVAKAFYQHYSSNDEYLAGMWGSMLPKTLLWHTRPRPTSVPSHRWRERIPGIPTWSCLSVTSPIVFEREHISRQSLSWDVETLSGTTKKVGQDPFGHVLGGRWRLSGDIRVMQLRMDRSAPTGFEIFKREDDRFYSSVYFDELPLLKSILDSDVDEVLLTVLRVCHFTDTPYRDYSLLLERTEDTSKKEYRRIGIYARDRDKKDVLVEAGLWDRCEIDLV